MDLIIVILLIIFAFCTGAVIEMRHYSNIISREKATLKYPTVSFGRKDALDPNRKVAAVRLVSACVVIAADNFKSFISSVKSFFGGRLSAYESVMDRARREAVLRLKDQSKDCDIILNLKIESVNIAVGQKNPQPKATIIAYGTAIKYE
jgi:uncharacterized protein YbjQ (UPF0145 family)